MRLVDWFSERVFFSFLFRMFVCNVCGCTIVWLCFILNISFTFQIFPSPACVVFSTWEIFLFVCASDTFGGVCKITKSLNRITDDRRRADVGGLKYSPDPFVHCCSCFIKHDLERMRGWERGINEQKVKIKIVHTHSQSHCKFGLCVHFTWEIGECVILLSHCKWQAKRESVHIQSHYYNKQQR